MTIEKFLSFWSHYNVVIIEGLVALIIVSSLFLAFRGFFAKKNPEESKSTGPIEIDTKYIESTLQKILENQAKISTGTRAVEEGMDDDLLADMGTGGLKSKTSEAGAQTSAATAAAASAVAAQGGGTQESPAEVAQLRLSLTETHGKVEKLLAQLSEAQQKLQAAEAALAAGTAEPGAASAPAADNENLLSKIRDLEARLTEYEIISEDIADLSKYREENDQLRRELEALRAGGASPAAAAAATPAPAPAPEVAAAPESTAAPTPEAAPATEEAATSQELIDEDLMKEFAAAVESQKAATALEGPEAGTSASDDAEKLLNEFENFVTKKS